MIRQLVDDILRTDVWMLLLVVYKQPQGEWIHIIKTRMSTLNFRFRAQIHAREHLLCSMTIHRRLLKMTCAVFHTVRRYPARKGMLGVVRPVAQIQGGVI